MATSADDGPSAPSAPSGLSGPSGPGAPSGPRSDPDTQVVIIGAGCAGIAAARALYEHGVHAILVEAKSCIGGRVCAGRPFTPNLTAVPDERRVVVYPGANWIHDLDETTNPLYRAALRMRVTLHATSPDHDPGVDVCVFDRGRVVPPDVYARARERYRWIRTHWNVSGDDASYEGMVRQTIADSHAVYGECGDVELRVLRWMTDLMANTLASPLGRVLKTPYAHAGTDSGDALVEGGYFEILRHLADEYPLDVRLGHRVTRVVDELTCVRVACRTAGGDETTLSARACLVTLPVGVLHSSAVAFVPRVPAHIQRVAASVSSGTMNLVWLWYPTAFWPEGYNFLGATRDATRDATFSTFLVPTVYDDTGARQPILMGQVAGEYATSIETQTPMQIAREATRVLRGMFGAEAVPDAIGCDRSAWSSDPLARGSWSYVDVSAWTSSAEADEDADADEAEDTEADEADEQRSAVYYAGEALSQDNTAHGAYLSGEREARRMIERLF
jgi:monoamine oxidase